MGLLKEPLNIDFVVDPRPLTPEEKKSIRAFILADKSRRLRQKTSKKGFSGKNAKKPLQSNEYKFR